MDDLIKTVSEKAGITGEQAKNAVNTVMEFIKNKAPSMGDHLKTLLSGGGNAGDMLGDLRKKIGI
jgi:hypothetical protein